MSTKITPQNASHQVGFAIDNLRLGASELKDIGEFDRIDEIEKQIGSLEYHLHVLDVSAWPTKEAISAVALAIVDADRLINEISEVLEDDS